MNFALLLWLGLKGLSSSPQGHALLRYEYFPAEFSCVHMTGENNSYSNRCLLGL